MPIPKELEFTEAIKALAKPLPSFLLAQYSWSLFGPTGRSKAIPLLSETISCGLSQIKESRSLPAIEWLRSDRMLWIAQTRLTKNYRLADVDQLAKEVYDQLMVRQMQRTSLMDNSTLRWRIIQETFDRIMSAETAWPLGLLWALREYHYEPQRIARYLAAKKEILKLHKIAMRGINALEEIISIVKEHSGEPPIKSTIYNPQRLLQRATDDWRLSELPIKRVDRTAPERLLAFRIWQVLRHLSPNKTSRIIQSVLLSEGVINQIDDRAVERMCAEFKRSGGVKINHRWLVEHMRGNDYRAEMNSKRIHDGR